MTTPIKWETDDVTRRYFEPRPLPENGTFELALVLGGTVSAGAYTAGVLDFLIEALDAWAARRGKDPAAPTHNVHLKVVAGTSGGGVNAAILTRALAYSFPPVRTKTPSAVAATNPFYDTWVNRLDLSRFLDTGDLKTQPVCGLLNAQPIDDGAAAIETFTGAGPQDRSIFVPGPLATILTITNLRGVAYTTSFGTASGETFIDHTDFARFAVTYAWHQPSSARPDEFLVRFDPPPPDQNGWRVLGHYARGTAAFPLGFPARNLSRPAQHYRYLAMVVPGDGIDPDRVMPLVPDVNQFGTAAGYDFPAVDGGATDNEPIELARVALSGIGGRNPREGHKAKRAVLLIDPFGGGASAGPQTISGVVDTIGPLLQSMIGQARYDSRDILLALRDDVYSRFIIAARRGNPSGGTWSGDEALAGAGLAAFMGFACADFRRHDYFLGRRNCQAFLRKAFVLPVGADAFGAGWNQVTDLSPFIVEDGSQKFLPLIPLFGDVAVDEPEPVWPRGAFQPEALRPAIEKRLVALATALAGSSRAMRSLAWAAAWLLKRRISNWIVAKMQAALKTAQLL
ncbi:MAG TPA: patatin-like phospholipase family protein [Magnetospirillaceae bacterium]